GGGRARRVRAGTGGPSGTAGARERRAPAPPRQRDGADALGNGAPHARQRRRVLRGPGAARPGGLKRWADEALRQLAAGRGVRVSERAGDDRYRPWVRDRAKWRGNRRHGADRHLLRRPTRLREVQRELDEVPPASLVDIDQVQRAVATNLDRPAGRHHVLPIDVS